MALSTVSTPLPTLPQHKHWRRGYTFPQISPQQSSVSDSTSEKPLCKIWEGSKEHVWALVCRHVTSSKLLEVLLNAAGSYDQWWPFPAILDLGAEAVFQSLVASGKPDSDGRP